MRLLVSFTWRTVDNIIFTPFKIQNLTINNRMVRAATYEGHADFNQTPLPSMIGFYEELAKNEVGLIITGFNATSQSGRAIQPRQASIQTTEQIKMWKKVTDRVHLYESKIFMQISHAGRQTLKKVTKQRVFAPSKIKSSLFRQTPTVLNKAEIKNIVSEYANAAFNAKEAGFDGVQIHAGHGYLVHQFLSPHINKRTDQYSGSEVNRFRFLKEILSEVKNSCGPSYPVIIKLNLGDDLGFSLADAKEYIKLLNDCNTVDAVELSYGTMDQPFNIIRGKTPWDFGFTFSPFFSSYPPILKNIVFHLMKNKIKKSTLPFCFNYNLKSAQEILNLSSKPMLLTGGIRKVRDIESILEQGFTAVTLSRPFIREPDLVKKIRYKLTDASKCINCNLCTIHCDSPKQTHCYLIS